MLMAFGAYLGLNLGSSWIHFGLLEGFLGLSWGIWGPSLIHFWLSWGFLWAIFGHIVPILGYH